MGRVGEAIGAGGQQIGEPAGQERILLAVLGFEAEQHAREPLGLARQQQVAGGLRFEPRRIDEGARARLEREVTNQIGIAGAAPGRAKAGCMGSVLAASTPSNIAAWFPIP